LALTNFNLVGNPDVIKVRQKSETNIPRKVNDFLTAVTEMHLWAMMKSAAGPASRPVMNAASGGAAVNRLSCIQTMVPFMQRLEKSLRL